MSKGIDVGIVLDYETANRITALLLKDYRDTLASQLKRWKKNPKTDDNPTGVWLHPEDVVGHKRRIKLIDELLLDFEQIQ
jgi:hypothetical protein